MQVVSERTVAETRNEAVTVRKAVLDFGRENVAGIKLTVLSSLEHPVTVEVVEEFPGHFSMADVQVHPGYNPEKWSISKPSRRMVFQDELAPWGEVETVYGVRVDPGDVDSLLNDPVIADLRVAGDEGADRPDPGDESATERSAGHAAASGDAGGDEGPSNGDAAADATGVEPDDSVGDDAPPPTSDDAPDGAQPGQPSAADGTGQTETESRPDPGAGDETPPDGESATEPPADTDRTVHPLDGSFVYGEDRSVEGGTDPADVTRAQPSAPEDATDADGPSTGTDVVQAFVGAVSRGELSADQLAAIREGLDVGGERHQDVQLDHLQAAVAKHTAFAEEFEAFVDAVGSPATAMQELRAAVERFDETQAGLLDRLDELSTAVGAADDDRADLREWLEVVSEAVGTGVEEREALRDRVDELSVATRAGAEDRDELRGRLDELSGNVRRAVGGREELESHVDTLAESVRTAAEDRAELQDRLDEVATATQAMGDARSELRHHLNDLLDATRVVAENLDALRGRFDRLERDLEARREERAAGLERLDTRVAELEGIFESDEAAALREIIAAERRWRQRHDEIRSQGQVSRSSGSAER